MDTAIDLIDEREGSAPEWTPTESLVAASQKGLSMTEVGRLFGLSKQAVSARFKRIGYTPAGLKAFRKHEDDLAALKRSQLLEGMTPEKIDKANLKDVTIAYGILKDKQAASQQGQNHLAAVIETIHKDGVTATRVTVGQTDSPEGRGGYGGLPATEDDE